MQQPLESPISLHVGPARDSKGCFESYFDRPCTYDTITRDSDKPARCSGMHDLPDNDQIYDGRSRTPKSCESVSPPQMATLRDAKRHTPSSSLKTSRCSPWSFQARCVTGEDDGSRRPADQEEGGRTTTGALAARPGALRARAPGDLESERGHRRDVSIRGRNSRYSRGWQISGRGGGGVDRGTSASNAMDATTAAAAAASSPGEDGRCGWRLASCPYPTATARGDRSSRRCRYLSL